MYIKSAATVGDLMEDIYAIEEISEDQIRLCFAGKQLEAARTLSSYNIHNSTVHLLLRVTGGDQAMFFVHVIDKDTSEVSLSMAVDEEEDEVIKIKRKIAEDRGLQHYDIVREACIQLQLQEEGRSNQSFSCIML